MKFAVKGGSPVEAASPLGLIEALREDTAIWMTHPDRETFIREYAHRASTQTGQLVRHRSEELFLISLEECGIISTTPISEADTPPADVLTFLTNAITELLPFWVIQVQWKEISGEIKGEYLLKKGTNLSRPLYADLVSGVGNILETAMCFSQEARRLERASMFK